MVTTNLNQGSGIKIDNVMQKKHKRFAHFDIVIDNEGLWARPMGESFASWLLRDQNPGAAQRKEYQKAESERADMKIWLSTEEINRIEVQPPGFIKNFSLKISSNKENFIFYSREKQLDIKVITKKLDDLGYKVIKL